MLLGPKRALISHCVLGKKAVGVPYKIHILSKAPQNLIPQIRTQLPVLTVVPPLRTAVGTLPLLRGQNQTLMKVVVRSIAYQPPPLELKVGP